MELDLQPDDEILRIGPGKKLQPIKAKELQRGDKFKVAADGQTFQFIYRPGEGRHLHVGERMIDADNWFVTQKDADGNRVVHLLSENNPFSPQWSRRADPLPDRAIYVADIVQA